MDAVPIPKMVKIHQAYDPQKIDDIKAHLLNELNTKVQDKGRFKGKRICITAGSRGIPGLDVMLRTMCDTLKEWGADPFIIPSMGSHGGGTAAGQLEMLEGYNVTEKSMGVPVIASMDVVQYDELDGIPLYCDKHAFESDGIVIFNKVKPHTDFRADHESGLAKMIAIGIAKHKGAAMFHSFGFERFGELIPPVAEKFLEKCPFAFGVGVVQNAYDDICNIEVCNKDNFMETDAKLLKISKEKIAKFLFDDIDVLVIDEIGKNISGNGHDPNVTGRNITHTFGKSTLNLRKLFVRGLTPEAHHNGCGLGSCDVTTRRCLNDVDWEVTWTNVLTTGIMDACMIPLYVNTDKEAVKMCIRTLHNTTPDKARVVHIKNTLCLEEIEVSEPLYESIKDMPGISFISGPVPMQFNKDGMMD
ncbi:MAG: nickel-dependent lactate racemase [Oscillospiraceae bacterium]|nr:nickel-dependent lactate racemase [Oscillospiraceae bacterium]